MTAITVNTDLLAAISRWAHTEDYRPIGVVAFRADGTIVATDGHRLAIVPHDTHGQSFGVVRGHLLAAIAAQTALTRDGVDPPIQHDTNRSGRLNRSPYGDRTITIDIDAVSITIEIAKHVRVIVKRVDLAKFPQVESVFVGNSKGTPDGYVIDARFLAALEEINTAHAGWTDGLRIVRWGRLLDDGTRTPLILENKRGGKFVIMPQRDTP